MGQEFTSAPGCTLTAGRAATHQALVGDRLVLPLDDDLATRVAGAPVAHPALVWNVAIGQSTVATHHVRANLFYRRLALLRQPAIGDTLRTVTRVVALRENTRRAGRPPTGLAALRMTTRDQEGRAVLDFYRCAMLPLRGTAATGRADDLDAVGAEPLGEDDLEASVAGWDLGAWARTRPPRGDGAVVRAGDVVVPLGGDVVTGAPELARLTLNVARVHHDERAAGGRRLVYGGHTIALASAQAARALPGLVTVLGWAGCDHVGPVHEEDVLDSEVLVERIRPSRTGGAVLDLRVRVRAHAEPEPRPVLDWRFSALHVSPPTSGGELRLDRG
ncbi:MaoC family dehydratase [Nocardioides zeae]